MPNYVITVKVKVKMPFPSIEVAARYFKDNVDILHHRLTNVPYEIVGIKEVKEEK